MNSLMGRLRACMLLYMLLLLMTTQPLRISGRGAGGGGGHGHARARRTHHYHSEEGRDHEGHKVDVEITVPGPPANIPQTCGMSNDTAFCEQTLTGNPNSKGKDLRQLSLLAVDMAKSKCAEISNDVSERLQDQQADMFASVNNALNVFLERYAVTLSDLEKAISALNTTDVPFDDVKHWISGGMTTSEVCKVAITEAKPDDVDLQNEGRSNTEFYKLCDNALSVVTALQFVTWARNLP